ncbi:MAG: glycosyltransferase [Comamonadaceae bacterium]|nr:glycosyltransferase [Comamonadaceae bacterium]
MPELGPGLVVVMPVYEDQQACSLLLRRLETQIVGTYSILVVDDGSQVHPFEFDFEARATTHGYVLRLEKNVGHQAAIAAGLQMLAPCVGNDQLVIVMDSDGEDPPESIPLLCASLTNGADIVAAARGKRHDSGTFKILYHLYRMLFASLTGQRINFGNFMLLRGSAVKQIACMPSSPVHLAATVLSSGLNLKRVRVDRGLRYAGRSKMNMLRLIQHGTASLSVFSEEVRHRLTIAGAVSGAAAVASTSALIGKASAMASTHLLPTLTAGSILSVSVIVAAAFLLPGRPTMKSIPSGGNRRSGDESRKEGRAGGLL